MAGLVSYAGVVSGSPLADDTPYLQQKLFEHVYVPTCPDGDGGGIASLRRETRVAWLAEHPLPLSVKYFSLAAFAERDSISAILHGTYDKLAAIDPRNDSQVIFFDAIIPGSTLLGYVNADHWAIAIPVTRDMPTIAENFITRNAFPREVLLEAVVRFVEEALLSSRARAATKKHPAGPRRRID